MIDESIANRKIPRPITQGLSVNYPSKIGPIEVRATSGANLGRPLFLVINLCLIEVRATSGANLGRPLF